MRRLHQVVEQYNYGRLSNGAGNPATEYNQSVPAGWASADGDYNGAPPPHPPPSAAIIRPCSHMTPPPTLRSKSQQPVA